MPDVRVIMFAFSSLHVGNLSFAQHIEEIDIKVMRMMNEKDVVLKFLSIFMNENMLAWVSKFIQWILWSYYHISVEHTLDNNNSNFIKSSYNPVDMHNLDVYLY